MNSSELRTIAKQIRDSIKDNTFSEDLVDESFKKNYKSLYDILISKDSYNEEIFQKLMSMKEKLEKGEDSYKVDVELGQYMAEKYIDPVIKKIPPKK